MSLATIQLKRATKATWEANSSYVAADGEPMLETDTRKLKFGREGKTWAELPYQESGITSGTGDERYPHFSSIPGSLTIAAPTAAGQGLFSTSTTAAEFRPERFTPVVHAGSYVLVAKDEAPKLHLLGGAGPSLTVNKAVFTVGDIVQAVGTGSGKMKLVAGSGMELKSPESSLTARTVGSLLVILFINDHEAWVTGDLE